MRYFILLFFIFTRVSLLGQNCVTLGQNPQTAFPVCGTVKYAQNDVPICGNRSIPGPCSQDDLTDKNPFWYKFTCFKAGTFGLVITPNVLSDDYDWQLFDVTGRNVADVYTDPKMVVSCNWSGEGGETGASSGGSSLFVCAGMGKPLYSSMPNLIKDHEYLLLISHFTNTQSGYKLEFKGGTTNITDTTTPAFKSSQTDCGGLQVKVKLNKQMRCASLMADGSDFSILPALANVIGASASACGSGFDMDSIVLSLDKPLPPGNYSVVAKNGTDGTTLTDYCNTEIKEGDRVPFTVFPVLPTPMDSLTTVACSPAKLQLVFRKPIKCASIASDGTDFQLSGPSGISVSSATGACNSSGFTTGINLTLSSAIVVGGSYKILLADGSDGNTIEDECGQQTPAGENILFEVKDTVAASFSYQVMEGCKNDTLYCSHDGRNGVNQWKWTFDNIRESRSQNSGIVYTLSGRHPVRLVVSNGVCSDSAEIEILVDEKIKAGFNSPDVICPKDVAVYSDLSTRNAIAWDWDFGNGFSSSAQNPGSQSYPAGPRETKFPVRLVVRDTDGCSDTLIKQVSVVNSCVISIPNAFTPNGDGKNDLLYPSNAWKAADLIFRVYNRYGQLIFETKDWNRRWDGTLSGRQQDPGTYVWILQYTLRDTGKRYTYRGSTVLIR